MAAEYITIWKNAWLSFNRDAFHFLRPSLLYLLYAAAGIAVLLWLANRQRRKWSWIVAPALRPFMFRKGSAFALPGPLLFYVAGAVLGILALAGPTWRKQQLPAEKQEAVLLIALDVSRSMLVKDIQPDRLARAKLKMADLLHANPRARAGLIAYAGSAHPVMPFTGDYALLLHQAESLNSRIMPVPGTNLPLLLQVADSMLKKTTVPGTLLLLTDVLTEEDAVQLVNFMHGNKHHLEILLLSATGGGRVPGYPAVLSQQNVAVVHHLAQDTSITVTPLTLDRSDVEGIATRIAQKLIFEKSPQNARQQWEDMGWLLLPPLLLITALWFRRGWMIQWCWLAFAVVSAASCGVKSKHPDWWYSKDYQGQLLEKAGRFGEAADRFQEEQYKAVAYFKAGNYEAAAELFALDSSGTARYNRGLSLARMGRYKEALQQWQEAAALDTSLWSKVSESAQQLQVAKKRADSLLQTDPRSETAMRALPADKHPKKKDPLKERKPESQDEQLSSDTKAKKLPTSGNRVTDEVVSNIHSAREAKKPPAQMPPIAQQQQAEQILLKQTAADPAEFLHRRFELQRKRYYPHITKMKEPW